METMMNEIVRLKERINEMSWRLSEMTTEMHEESKAVMDYIAMMSDIDIPEEETHEKSEV